MLLILKNRRSLTPPDGAPAAGRPGVHKMRRESARHEVSDRVVLHGADGQVREGWALNVSRGGVRVILEDSVQLGSEHDVVVGDVSQGGVTARGRIVWVQEEPDGAVVGVEFTSAGKPNGEGPPDDRGSARPLRGSADD